MPKKTATIATSKPAIVKKLMLFPADWVERIDKLRGDESFSDFVREAIADKIGRKGLSEMPGWGKGRTKE